MTERKSFTCDFNPNTPEHVASYRINDGEHESLGLGSKDACIKHLPSMVAIAVDRLHSNDRVCVTRLPETPEPVRSSPQRLGGTGVTVDCPRCDKQLKSVSGYIGHIAQYHDLTISAAEAGALFRKAIAERKTEART